MHTQMVIGTFSACTVHEIDRQSEITREKTNCAIKYFLPRLQGYAYTLVAGTQDLTGTESTPRSSVQHGVAGENGVKIRPSARNKRKGLIKLEQQMQYRST